MPEQSPLLTISDWRQAYLSGASPRELLTRQLAALGQQDPAAWIHKATAAELEPQLAALEAQLAAANNDRAALLSRLPLFGIPFAAKDNIDVAGMPTTAACPAFAYTPATHAHTVQRLIAAGAVCLGKTNLDQFATGLVGARSPYGRPHSAFDAQRVSGGSSSGSAVAVARAEVAFSLGTDTAGSGRVPASFNNLVGLKPTPGRVGTSGVVPACRTLDCVSVFALTVEDAATVLAVIEGVDARDEYSRFEPGPAQLPAKLRIGVPMAPEVDDIAQTPAWSMALQLAEELGHRIVPLDFQPLHAVADLLYNGPWVAERHAVVQELLARDPQAIDATVRRVIEGAIGRTATDAFKAQYALRAAQRDTAALWQDVDVMMVPTAPRHPSFAALDADPVGVNTRLGRYTNFVNLLGWCALALPGGFDERGLPFGVTFIAPRQADAALARFGMGWQAATALPLGATQQRRERQPAPVWPASEPTLPLAVVGAHLSGMPLNSQLTERGATLREATTTAPCYRLHALRGTVPPKPGLQRVGAGGASIAVEVWNVPLRHVGSLLALIPAPLGLGSVQLADGSSVHGFICEGLALADATDITPYGGWRAYMADQRRD
ncbi:allophanate hydrolase [Kinneretia asaccharophila]|uniref:Allophanate hydrolase n=2 Tax=Roseateles asaccharophilus TaxID=582607 RepID=A0ABU2A316_9BURK|nr:allophanate hydrolase [Roseateles asaccharophilus]